jgi:hypothetical protein
VQAGAVVVAAELGNAEVELCERVRAVDEHGHTLAVCHVRDLAHRQDLARDVDDVRDQQQPRALRDRVRVERDDLVVGGRVDRQRHEAVREPEAPGLLLEHQQHRAVVLVRHHRFVAALPVEARDHRVERLGRVAGHDQLVDGAAGELREPGARRQLVVRLARAHVERGIDVDRAHVRGERFEHVLGRARVVAVLEVDAIGRQAIPAAQLLPEVARRRCSTVRAEAPWIELREQGPRSRRPGRAQEVTLVHPADGIHAAKRSATARRAGGDPLPLAAADGTMPRRQ